MDPITLALIMGGVGAGSQFLQGEAARKAKFQDQMANAEAIRYSPWTGMRPNLIGASGQSQAANILGGAAQGGAQGAMFGQQFQKGAAPAAAATPAMTPGEQALFQEETGQAFSPWAGMDPRLQKRSLYSGSVA